VPAEKMSTPYNAPRPGNTATMDGFVADYISAFNAELGRQPTYDEDSQIMTGYTPEQMPVLPDLARGFATFDHWFREVPSQTFTDRHPRKSSRPRTFPPIVPRGPRLKKQ
jgi:phospholipase C